MKCVTSDTRSWTRRSCSTGQGLTTLVRYNLFWKPLRRAFSPTFVLLFCLCWSLEEYLVHVRPLKSRFTIFKTDKKSILIPARLMNDRKGIIDRLLKYSRLITTWIALRNGACRSVSPAKSRVPWLFARSQRKPTHVAPLIQNSSVSVLFPRYKGNLT